MSDRPMRAASRSRRPPGFAEGPPAQSPAGAPRETSEDIAGRDAAAQPPPHDQEAADAARPDPRVAPPRDPYADAPSRQFNTRLLEPLHARYVQLVRELEAEGYRTTMTELLHALLDAGPTSTDEARELVRAWRRKREP